MTPELEDRLFEAFPQLFRGRSKPMSFEPYDVVFLNHKMSNAKKQ